MPEYIYVLTNPHMPGLVKIGRTLDVQRRVIELSGATGVPGSFEVAHVACVADGAYAERDAHDVLVRHRISFSREFFKCSVEQAVTAVDLAVRVDTGREAEGLQFANWLHERTDLAELPTIISWLEGTKAKDVIAALRRQAA
jgi:hypothetical protein